MSKSKKSRPKTGGKNKRPPRQKAPRSTGSFEMRINAMAHGGYGLGSHQRRTTFVPYTIPGELVQARVVQHKGRVDFAQGEQLLDASADRVTPHCPHFGPGRCWGCQWQHIDYAAQLLLKQDVLADQLSRVGQFDDATLAKAVQPVIAAPQQWGYNANMTLERASSGALGFRRMDGSIAPIQECHVLHPDLQALYETLELDYEDMERLALWRGSDGATMLIITMHSEEAPELLADLPTSVNVLLPDNEPANLVGASALHYDVGGRSFRVTAGSSFRANVPQIDNLVGAVLELLKLHESDSALDLYAGVGVFSAFMAHRADLVTLVESYPPAVTDADENLSDFENVNLVEGSVESVLPDLLEAGERFDAAVLDPPSSGLSRDALAALLALEIPRLVYVSGDPATLARDAQALCKQGYQLERVQLLDFAPQTYYIECAALLVRG